LEVSETLSKAFRATFLGCGIDSTERTTRPISLMAPARARDVLPLFPAATTRRSVGRHRLLASPSNIQKGAVIGDV
jgi:hypothetical protein